MIGLCDRGRPTLDAEARLRRLWELMLAKRSQRQHVIGVNKQNCNREKKKRNRER